MRGVAVHICIGGVYVGCGIVKQLSIRSARHGAVQSGSKYLVLQ